MVKGVARRVILVESPDPALFEHAFFLVKEEAFGAAAPDQVLKEAESSAKHYMSSHRMRPRPMRLSPPICFAGGAALASVVWGVCMFL